MKITAEPRSDQWNADDFVGGPRTFTIAEVVEGKAEQKYDIKLIEGEGRVWRPPLTILRVLIEAWGNEAANWIGRRVTLYRDEKVRFGPEQVGGIRISHMSDLPNSKPFTARVTISRGRKGPYTVQPLPDTPPPAQQTAEPADPEQWDDASTGPTVDEIAASTDENELRNWWESANQDVRTQIEARVQELRAQNAGEQS